MAQSLLRPLGSNKPGLKDRDVLIEDVWRPGISSGRGYPEALSRIPALIVAAMAGFGQHMASTDLYSLPTRLQTRYGLGSP